MQCRVTRRQEEEEIMEAKDVRTERMKRGLERRDESQDGSRDEKCIEE